jgi:hypothetical protein
LKIVSPKPELKLNSEQKAENMFVARYIAKPPFGGSISLL